MAGDVIDEMKHIAGNKFDKTKVELLMNELFPGENIDVPDPWYGPEPGYHQVFKMIDEACEAIIRKY
jgi:protein-tyrosine phosphatase